MQYNHGQSGSSNGNGNQKSASVADPGSSLASVLELSTLATVGETLQEGISSILENVEEIAGGSEAELPKLQIPDTFVEAVEEKTGAELDPDAADPEAEAETPAVETPAPEVEAPAVEEAEVPETPDDSENTETTEENGNNPEGFEWGNGNGEVPPGQNVDEDGNIVNNGGHMPPGLNRGEKPDKDDNPNPPEVPEDPGTEDSSDKSANKANKGTHIYTYDELNRMVTSNIAKELTTYTYDTLGNLVSETVKNKTTDYQYNELNQLVSRSAQNQDYTYDKRGNRVTETGKKESQAFVYDETNRLVEGTNWKGDKSSYTYNGLGVRINNTQTSHSGSVYSRDYVIDYTSLERDDLMVYAEGGGQLDYVQREVYAGSERIEQFTDRSNGGYERLLYVHEDLQGNTRYYTKDNGQSFAELTYDAWDMPESPNKLLNNDHGNYVYATYTGHIFDTTLDIYLAEARFYDAQTRQWLAMDPIKDGGNWYQYCYSNPLTYGDPTGLAGFSLFECGSEWLDNFLNDMKIRENASADYRDSFQMGQSDAIIGILSVSAGNTVSEIGMVLSFLFGDTEKVDMYMAAISTNEIDYEALSGRASDKEAYYQGVKSGSNSMYLIGLAVSAFGSYAAATGGTGFAAGAGASVTGAGALVGVPAMTVSAGVIALGSGVTVSGANISMTSQNSLNQAKGKLNELADQGDSDSTHMLGENGTQIGGSKTTGKNGGTERVDVENPAPGERPGDLHYHESNNTKWRYDVNTGNLVDPDTGELAPSRVQKVTEETWFQNAIKKGLKILGE